MTHFAEMPWKVTDSVPISGWLADNRPVQRQTLEWLEQSCVSQGREAAECRAAVPRF